MLQELGDCTISWKSRLTDSSVNYSASCGYGVSVSFFELCKSWPKWKCHNMLSRSGVLVGMWRPSTTVCSSGQSITLWDCTGNFLGSLRANLLVAVLLAAFYSWGWVDEVEHLLLKASVGWASGRCSQITLGVLRGWVALPGWMLGTLMSHPT